MANRLENNKDGVVKDGDEGADEEDVVEEEEDLQNHPLEHQTIQMIQILTCVGPLCEESASEDNPVSGDTVSLLLEPCLILVHRKEICALLRADNRTTPSANYRTWYPHPRINPTTHQASLGICRTHCDEIILTSLGVEIY